MEPSIEAEMEGYLQKRFKSGIVKTLKKKWYVLKAGEIRCYQSKDACQQNGEMYQERLLVSNVQAVRPASENHGVEVVTQPKTYILVASNAEDQQKWVKAIYEAMKDNRPRSVSSPTGPTDKQPNRKRSSTGPRERISRILSGFDRRSASDSQGHGGSQFYVDPQPQPQQTAYAEIGVQANLPKNQMCEKVEEGEENRADDVFEAQTTTADTTEVKEVIVEKSPEGDSSIEFGQQSSPCFDCETQLEYSEIFGNHVPSASDPGEVTSEASLDTVQCDTKQENGMYELELMLRNSSISDTDDTRVADSDGSCDSDDDNDDNDDDDDDDDDDGDDDDDEALTNKPQGQKSAFEQLQELLQKT